MATSSAEHPGQNDPLAAARQVEDRLRALARSQSVVPSAASDQFEERCRRHLEAVQTIREQIETSVEALARCGSAVPGLPPRAQEELAVVVCRVRSLLLEVAATYYRMGQQALQELDEIRVELLGVRAGDRMLRAYGESMDGGRSAPASTRRQLRAG